MNGRVLVACSSRDRPEYLEKMIASVTKTSTVADVAVYIDDDQKDKYVGVKGKYRMFCGYRMWPCKSLNLIVKAMPGYEAYGAATDDCEFISDGWDQWVLRAVDGFKSRIGVICPQTVNGYKKRMDFPWVSGNWLKVVGGLVPYETQHFYWDVGLQILGEQTQIIYATEQEFGLSHDEQFPAAEQPKEGKSSAEPTTDYGRRVLYAYSDGKETCRFLAIDRHAMLDKINKAIEEGV